MTAGDGSKNHNLSQEFRTDYLVLHETTNEYKLHYDMFTYNNYLLLFVFMFMRYTGKTVVSSHIDQLQSWTIRIMNDLILMKDCNNLTASVNTVTADVLQQRSDVRSSCGPRAALSVILLRCHLSVFIHPQQQVSTRFCFTRSHFLQR